MRGKDWARALALTLIPAAAVVWLRTLPSPWGGWRPATCMPDACFCEALRDSLVRQPANTLSSLGFVVAASLVAPLTGAARRRRSSANPLVTAPVYPALYTGALLLIGLGSAFYHASLTFVGQTGDVLGMYLLGTFLLLYNWHRHRGLTPAQAAVWYLCGNGALLILLVELPELRRYAFAAIVLGALYLEWIVRRERQVAANTRLLLAAIGSIAVGFALWIMDITGALCSPTSPVQGHAAWHLLGAASALLVYRYYLSERVPGG